MAILHHVAEWWTDTMRWKILENTNHSFDWSSVPSELNVFDIAKSHAFDFDSICEEWEILEPTNLKLSSQKHQAKDLKLKYIYYY